MPSRNARKERIYSRLLFFVEQKIIRDELVVHGQMPGIRWVIGPNGYSERAMTTSEIECFILGVEAARNTAAQEKAVSNA